MIKNNSALNKLSRSPGQLGGECNVTEGWASERYSSNYKSSGDASMLLVFTGQSAVAASPSVLPLLLLICPPHQPLNETAIVVLVGQPEPGLFPALLVVLYFCLCIPMR